MKLIEALLHVNKDDSNQMQWFDLEEFCTLAGTNQYETDNVKIYTRLRAYWVECWYCTDTWVGTQAIYLDDRLVAIATQTARKSDYVIRFLGVPEAELVCAWIRECIADDDANYPIMSFEEMHEEIGTHSNVHYESQLLTKTGVVDGRPAKFLTKAGRDDDFNDLITVEFEDGEWKNIPVTEFKIKYRVDDF